jgi:hypothetical protein
LPFYFDYFHVILSYPEEQMTLQNILRYIQSLGDTLV